MDKTTQQSLLTLKGAIEHGVGMQIAAIRNYSVYDDGEVIGTFRIAEDLYRFGIQGNRFTAAPLDDREDGFDQVRDRLGRFARTKGAELAGHLGENVVAWGTGKVLGGLVAQIGTAHGIDPDLSKRLGETAVQALTATALHARHTRDPLELGEKFISEAAAAFLGKASHSAVDDSIAGADEHVRAIASLITGKTVGAATAATVSRGLRRQSKAIGRLLASQRHDHVSGDVSARTDVQPDISRLEQEALFDLALAGYLLASEGDRADGLRLDKLCGKSAIPDGWKCTKDVVGRNNSAKAETSARALIESVAKRTGKTASDVEDQLFGVAKVAHDKAIKGGKSKQEAQAISRQAVQQEAQRLFKEARPQSRLPDDDNIIAQGKFQQMITRTRNDGNMFRVKGTDGNEYFAKRTGEKIKQAEIVNQQFAKDLGIGDDMMPVKAIQRGKATLLVSPFAKKGPPLRGDDDDDEKNYWLRNDIVDRDKAAQLLTYDLITGQIDRNPGNVIGDGGKLKLIDNELCFGRTLPGHIPHKLGMSTFDVTENTFYKHAAANFDGAEVPINKAMVQKARENLSQHREVLRKNGFNDKQIKQYEARLNVLEKVANSKTPTFEEYLRQVDPKGWENHQERIAFFADEDF